MAMGLVTNYGEGGGATKRERGHVKFTPTKRGGGMLKVGHKKFWGSFYAVA